MSTFSCPVVEFTLEKIEDSDFLSIAHIKGWQCVVRTEDFHNELFGVYVPLDAIADGDKVSPLLDFLEGKKVKTKRLRKVYSQGVLLPLGAVKAQHKIKEVYLGQDLSSVLGMKKWEQRLPVDGAGRTKTHSNSDEAPTPPWLYKYTDIENWNYYPDTIKEGEEVNVTEKLHGTSARFAMIDGKFHIGSRNRCLKHEPYYIRENRFQNRKLNSFVWRFGLQNTFLFAKKKLVIPNRSSSVWHHIYYQEKMYAKLWDLQKITGEKEVAIYGEIVGVQDLMYGLQPGEVDFYAYDIRVGKNDYVDYPKFLELCGLLNLKTVPQLYTGPYKPELLELRKGKTTIPNASHIREGVVIRPLVERRERGARVILKRVSEEYLLRKNDVDLTID